MILHIYNIVLSSSTQHILLLHITNYKHLTLYITHKLEVA
jgi:hypothetical protein